MSNISKNPYTRVGTTYLKKINQPLASGDFMTILVNWNLNTIKQDESPELIKTIPKYDSFCIIPDHLNFKKEIGKSYNRYEPFEHIAKKGDCKHTLSFLKHIFDDQIELGFDYLKLLLERPTQILPILCLVSEERNTGKTTFLNYLKAFFGANMTINTNEDFRSQFNSDWASKLIIGVDEVLLDKKEDSERIKSLSTSRSIKSESKGIDKSEINFFGKFILCSNNEETFIKIDPEEIRYWIRKVPVLKSENTKLLEDLKNEIPYFLNFIIERKYSTESNSRMWFTPQQIFTPALLKVKQGNRSAVEKEIKELILEELFKFELEEISFIVSDIQDLFKTSFKPSNNQVSDVLKRKWGLAPNITPSTYKRYYLDYSVSKDGFLNFDFKKGRYYTFEKKFLENM